MKVTNAQHPKFIIVQAGGKGSRMGQLTRNKPKALVPIDNLPMIFHLFKKYPDSRYIIIGDCHYEVLQKYLAAFASVSYTLVNSSGNTGTCSGMQAALQYVPDAIPFLLIWSDLILPPHFILPDRPGNYVGIAKDFPCRWKFEDGVFQKENSATHGVAGLFYLQDAAQWRHVPEHGSLVPWLAESGEEFNAFPIYGMREYGLLSEYQKTETARCRPFNRISRQGDLLVKEPIDTQGQALLERESAWYKKIYNLGFADIPKVHAYAPVTMEYIDGKPVYECTDLSVEGKSLLLKKIIASLKHLHSLGEEPSDQASFEDAYIGKTLRRLEKVRNLVPFANDRTVVVNNRECRNIFFSEDVLRQALASYFPASFQLLHGDCTLSNIMLRQDRSPVFIDPRGYFGTTRFYGDPAYDWAKLYYSIAGNYDQFNRKHFDLNIGKHETTLKIESNGWESLEGEFFDLLEGQVVHEQIHLLHAIIWLSLTTYAWEDYDSICGAFYQGLYYLEGALRERILS